MTRAEVPLLIRVDQHARTTMPVTITVFAWDPTWRDRLFAFLVGWPPPKAIPFRRTIIPAATVSLLKEPHDHHRR